MVLQLGQQLELQLGDLSLAAYARRHRASPTSSLPAAVRQPAA